MLALLAVTSIIANPANLPISVKFATLVSHLSQEPASVVMSPIVSSAQLPINAQSVPALSPLQLPVLATYANLLVPLAILTVHAHHAFNLLMLFLQQAILVSHVKILSA